MTENPLVSLHDTIALDSRDWSEDRRSAWVYGIVCGWDEASLVEVQQRFQWTHDTLVRLRRLRRRYVQMTQRPLDPSEVSPA